jgi:hypothetical protein
MTLQTASDAQEDRPARGRASLPCGGRPHGPGGVRRDDPRGRDAAARPEGAARGSGRHRPAECAGGPARPHPGAAGAPPLSGRGGGGGAAAPAARPALAGAGGLASRAAPGDRAGSAPGGEGPCQLAHWPAGPLPGRADGLPRRSGHGAGAAAPGGLCLPAADLDGAAAGPAGSRVGKHRRRGEALLAAPARPSPPPADPAPAGATNVAAGRPDASLVDRLPPDDPVMARRLAVRPQAEGSRQD